MSSAVTEDSEDGGSSVLEQVGPEAIESHDVSDSSLGSGRDHSGEEQDSVNSLRESETAAPADATERSVGSESVKSKQGTCLCSVWISVLSLTTRGCRETTACAGEVILCFHSSVFHTFLFSFSVNICVI